jgi:type II secretory pathway predicted ATPase ExeA
MKPTYRSFFGLHKEPFSSDLPIEDILLTAELAEVTQRFEYTLRIGGVGVLTGEIGSGKSTALRYAAGKLHPAEYYSLYLTATTGSILELYRQILTELGIEQSTASKAMLTRSIRQAVVELVEAKKMKVALVIDEASLLRLEVLSELHTICQFDKDSKPYLPLILAGQGSLIDKLSYRSSAPLASRVICRAHLQGLNNEGMGQYLSHHLRLAGVKKNLFDETATTAIHQGSGGLLRKANHLARGALIAAAIEKSTTVSAEHVRIAATEVF